MSKKWSAVLGLICFVTIILYLFHVFVPSDSFVYMYSVMSIILLLCAIPRIHIINIWVTIVLLGFGVLFFIQGEASPFFFLAAFGSNINLLSLFVLVPFVGLYLSVSGYLTLLKYKFMELEQKNAAHPYRVSFILTASMGFILNFGSMAIVHRIAEETFSNYYRNKLVLVILRGFGFCMFWSPYFVNVGLVLVLFDIPWATIGWIGFILALLYTFFAILFFPAIRFSEDMAISREEKEQKGLHSPRAKLYPLYLFAGILLIFSFVLDFLLSVNMLTIVALLSCFYPLMWALFSKRLKEYIQEVVIYVNSLFEKLKNEIAIFIAAGFFGTALSQTDIGLHISSFILNYSFGMIFVFSLFVILFAIILAMIGIHPVVIILGMGSALSPEVFGVSPQYMAMLLLVAWTLATQLSPFSGSVLMASGLLTISPWKISRQNVYFVLTLTFVLPFVLFLMHAFNIL